VISGNNGLLSWNAISQGIRPRIYYRPQTSMIALENTHNMAGGTVYETSLVNEICDKAHELGIVVHMDGARIFNAAAYLNEDVADMTSKCDSVQFCLSKGLGAPAGSVITGSRELIERCRSIRKMLGGGMRQAGVLAAAGLVALENGPGRLHIDHANAQRLAAGLSAIPGIILDAKKVQTNIVIFALARSGMSSAYFIGELKKHDILALPVDAQRVRMVTHLEIDSSAVDDAIAAASEIMKTNENAR